MESVVELSHYDASHPSSGDSIPTEKTKERMKVWITDLFRKKGFKTWIREEVGYVHFDEDLNKPIPYHLDLAVLTKNRESFDGYNVFAIELDWDVGHATKITDSKDARKDRAFRKIRVPIVRFRMEEVYGKKALSDPERDKKIWDSFAVWFEQLTEGNNPFPEQNRELAIKLKENSLTQCRNPKCKHNAAYHDLGGCSYRNSNKAAMYCPCSEPFFTSDI